MYIYIYIYIYIDTVATCDDRKRHVECEWIPLLNENETRRV